MKYLSWTICLLIIPILLFAPLTLNAQSLKDAGKQLETTGKGVYGGTPPVTKLPELVGKYIRVFLTLLGVVFTILIIYGGYTWMTSFGNAEKAKKGKELIVDAVIGLIIILAAYTISTFVVASLLKQTAT